MKFRVYDNDDVEIVDEWKEYHNPNPDIETSNFTIYEVNDNGCQGLNCEIEKPKQGHNGGCLCFREIPTYHRLLVRKWWREISK